MKLDFIFVVIASIILITQGYSEVRNLDEI